ncbi:DUF721 domain-containing protein [Arthrospira platensis]|uniref:DUF721 domain-containing protein n=1 Tax=Limnospira TaxID=2596745 RepID=UPI0001C38C3C|nr:DciA family protein [Arthrospira platensis]AMW30999.1 hypothetical protein AP285_26820 [Arthrospira platensis YZ]KDR54768.1 hypothetical protein APPUASWS_026580 [Arthrospira platensis str. Paraca]MBD2669587.1 DUF721 domain-containing protein [Arthrospira platensis FACHB-439]MBD2711099.1 DUF721 domain-containing protein [Arthrospira platensis FACHB-835]MDT9310454.1 DciA family protein [Limnospira sp. Paracas R14]QQW28891.1 DciA family protein [Arthrospira sp. PCC 9108]
MNFESIDQIISTFADRILTPEQQQFQLVVSHWPDVVGKSAQAHTRPITIYRNILQVATSSAAWTQELTFQRKQIVRHLNQWLCDPLHDIKFSTAQWSHGSSLLAAGALTETTDINQHPSTIPVKGEFGTIDQVISEDVAAPKTPIAAWEIWASKIQRRSQHWPLCPQCHSPTPPGELERWSVCHICFAELLTGDKCQDK